jgi:hypothetical protein
MFDSDAERRVLGHLPAWAADEDAVQQHEVESGGGSHRSFTVVELTERVNKDKGMAIGQRTPEQMGAFLANLKAKGFASDAEGRWSMTEAGLSALVDGPALAEHEQTPGPVELSIRV